jgi:hypothetical protein
MNKKYVFLEGDTTHKRTLAWEEVNKTYQTQPESPVEPLFRACGIEDSIRILR